MTPRCEPVHKTFHDSIKKSITAKPRGKNRLALPYAFADPSSAATRLHVDGEAFIPTQLRHCCLLSYLAENVMSPPSQAGEAGVASSKLSNFCSCRVKEGPDGDKSVAFNAKTCTTCASLVSRRALAHSGVGCPPPTRHSHTRSLSCLLLFWASGLFSLLLGAAEAAVEEQR